MLLFFETHFLYYFSSDHKINTCQFCNELWLLSTSLSLFFPCVLKHTSIKLTVLDSVPTNSRMFLVDHAAAYGCLNIFPTFLVYGSPLCRYVFDRHILWCDGCGCFVFMLSTCNPAIFLWGKSKLLLHTITGHFFIGYDC